MSKLRYTDGRSFVVEAILKALEENGPMTASEICRTIGRDRYDVAAVISRMSKSLPTIPRRLHTTAWVRDDGNGGRTYLRAVYALGDKRNAPRPKATPGAEKSRNWREAQRLKVTSVFELGISLRTRNEHRKQVTGRAADRGESLREAEDSAHALQYGKQPGPMPTHDHQVCDTVS